MTSVLVLDGGQRSALAVVRSLGRRGIQVHVADTVSPCLAGVSRYAHSQWHHPDPQSSPAQFVTWVHDISRRLRIDLVFPATDVTTMLLAPHRETPGAPRIVCAPHTAYEQVTDKFHLLQIANRAQVRTPRTFIATSLQEIEEHLSTARFPIVLKPARSRLALHDRIIDTTVYIAQSKAEALVYARAQVWLGAIPCLLQEFIEGHGAGVFALYSEGRPVAWFAHRRLREKPPQGGVSVLCESAAVSTSLREAAQRLLTEAKWNGAAMVEFRVDRAGNPYLMEVNGRLWGSLQLAIDSGIDFPWLLFRAANGECVEAV